MNLISLELNRSGNSGDGAPPTFDLIGQLQTLIRGVALHSIESQPEDFAKLQEQAAEIAKSLAPESSGDDLLVAISRTLRTLEDYNRKASGLFKAQTAELRGMIAAVTETLQFMVSSSDTSVKQLSFVESQLQRAQGLDDLRQLKTYTSSCLNLVRRESARLQLETKEKVEALKQDVSRLAERLKTAALEDSEDPLTGLPARAAAEQAIESRVSTGRPCLTALFLMERLATINGKFGHDVGDDIVMSCAQMLARKLSGATLFRWSGPSFLAVFDPLVPPAEAESKARQAAAQQLEKNIEAGGRTLMVVVAVSCQVYSVSSQTNPAEMFRQLDGQLVVGQG